MNKEKPKRSIVVNGHIIEEYSNACYIDGIISNMTYEDAIVCCTGGTSA